QRRWVASRITGSSRRRSRLICSHFFSAGSREDLYRLRKRLTEPRSSPCIQVPCERKVIRKPSGVSVSFHIHFERDQRPATAGRSDSLLQRIFRQVLQPIRS